jgi:DNA mismatch repair protein MutS
MTRWKLMATPDHPRPEHSLDAVLANARTDASAHAPRFESILFDRPTAATELARTEPDFFSDLNLDQVVEALIAGREEYELKPFFWTALHDAETVRYRHHVLRELEKPGVLEVVTTFGETMRRMRQHLDLMERLHYELQKQAFFVDAVEIYCAAVQSLLDGLEAAGLDSSGFRGLRAYLRGYVASELFTSLVAETKDVKHALSGIRYRLRIQSPRVTISRYEGEADYSVEVLETFARFRQGAVRSYLVSLTDHVELNHVEARILDGVAQLHPDAFAHRRQYCARHGDYVDLTIARFDREIQFYVAYLDLIGRLRAAGLALSYPRVSARCKEVAAAQTFDIALASKLIADGREVVRNDLYLDEPERVFVVSGPNNGGKTTFARTFGQLHYLGSLGVPVPGSEARLFLPDRIYTHFEREEDIETLRGKFEDELLRVHEILGRATARSVIVMNESFNSTTLSDALFVGTEVMRRILELGCLGVYVTFVDEIASLSEATVSVVTQIAPENPAERTYKVLRRPADGLAYAWAIAERHGLTYERLVERIAE